MIESSSANPALPDIHICGTSLCHTFVHKYPLRNGTERRIYSEATSQKDEGLELSICVHIKVMFQVRNAVLRYMPKSVLLSYH